MKDKNSNNKSKPKRKRYAKTFYTYDEELIEELKKDEITIYSKLVEKLLRKHYNLD